MKAIDDLLALEAQATPGEWYEIPTRTVGSYYQYNPISVADELLIVAMRNHIVALCEIAKAAEQLLRYWEYNDKSIDNKVALHEALTKLNGE